jgi:hypothetical protein
MLLVWHGSVLPSLPQLLLVLLISPGALYDDGRLLGTHVHLDTAPFSLLGISLAIFLAFRNNASYQRYLEARQLWGNILISSRSLTSQMLTSLPEGGSTTRRLPDRCKLRPPGARHQLRNSDPRPDLDGLLPPEQVEKLAAGSYRPILVLKELRRTLNLAAQDLPHGGQLMQIRCAAQQPGNSMGGCEAHRARRFRIHMACCYTGPSTPTASFAVRPAACDRLRRRVDLGSGGLHPVRWKPSPEIAEPFGEAPAAWPSTPSAATSNARCWNCANYRCRRN